MVPLYFIYVLFNLFNSYINCQDYIVSNDGDNFQCGAGYNASTVALRVIEGNEKGTQSLGV
jgi:hypothetical protein